MQKCVNQYPPTKFITNHKYYHTVYIMFLEYPSIKKVMVDIKTSKKK